MIYIIQQQNPVSVGFRASKRCFQVAAAWLLDGCAFRPPQPWLLAHRDLQQSTLDIIYDTVGWCCSPKRRTGLCNQWPKVANIIVVCLSVGTKRPLFLFRLKQGMGVRATGEAITGCRDRSIHIGFKNRGRSQQNSTPDSH